MNKFLRVTKSHVGSFSFVEIRTQYDHLRSKPDAIQFTVTEEVPSSAPEEEDTCVCHRS